MEKKTIKQWVNIVILLIAAFSFMSSMSGVNDYVKSTYEFHELQGGIEVGYSDKKFDNIGVVLVNYNAKILKTISSGMVFVVMLILCILDYRENLSLTELFKTLLKND